MTFFKPKHSVCAECGVHFEPVGANEARWGNLCATHRKPVMERDRKKRDVMFWAEAHWERLAVMMEREEIEQRAKYQSASYQEMSNRFNG